MSIFYSSSLKSIILISIFLLFSGQISAVVTVTKASGGINISADKAANAISPLYTTLGIVRLTEAAITDFSIGTNVTLTLTAPAGWEFNPGSAVTATCTNGRDISSPSVSVTSVTSTVVTVQFTVGGIAKSDVLTVSGIQTRATEGANIVAAVNITSGGTAVINGCSAGTSLGLLSQVAGNATNLLITFPGEVFTDAATFAASGNSGTPTAQTAASPFTITSILGLDQFRNIATTYVGTKTLTYSGPSSGVSAPTYTTNVNFNAGASTTALTTNLKKAESTTITVTDGSLPGIISSSLTVNPGALNNFAVQNTSGGNIPSEIASIAFNIMVTARDAENNTCSSGPNVFTGTANITSTGTISAGSGVTPAFVAGMLASRSVTISNTGIFTITATKTAGVETGTSNSFAVDANVLNNFLLQSAAGGAISAQIAGTPFAIKLTARDANNNICSSGPNAFTGTVDISSTGTLSVGSGTSVAFTAGILASHSVTISNTGTFTMTSIKTGGGFSVTSNSFIVTAGGVNNFLVQASAGGNIGTQLVGTSFTIKLTARDADNNICNSGPNSFTGTADITSSGTLSMGGGTTLSFSSGVLASTSVRFSDGGTFTITATKTSGSEYGTSNSFIVINPSPGLSSISPSCITPGGPDFVLAVSGSNFIPSSIVKFNGFDKTTTFINNTSLQADIPASDIATAGIYNITVYNPLPGGGTSSSSELKLNTANTANVSICQGSNYILPDGVSQNTSGTYTSHIPNARGCDSAITTNLTVNLITSSTANISICSGSNYVLADGVSQNTSGTYISHIPNAAGCDSTITTNLTVIANSSSTANISICQGSNYILPDGVSHNSSGTYISHIPNTVGCDSAITTNLTVIANSSSTANISICQGSSYLLPDGVSHNTSGTYISHIPNTAGCDSTITTNLTFIPNSSSTANISICQGSNYILPDGVSQNTSGTYTSHTPNTAGCDSAITTNLTVIPNSSSTANIFICQGSNYILPDGASQNTTGTYVSHIPNAAGCDSTITTNLSVITNSSSTANISICSGANYILPDGVSQNSTGTYVSHIPNAAGCDSAITTNLTVINNSSSTANISICQGSNYVLPDGVSHNTSGTYISHIPNTVGCDSAITTNLTVINNSSSTANISICQGSNYVLPDGVSQNTTGIFVSHIPNAAGCDSTITTNLSVITNSSSTANISICSGANYILPDGVSQNSTGTYVSHIPNAAGCDSAITTNLTVIPNSSSTANISICQGSNYILPDGVSQNSAGTYISHIANATGFDSTIITNLTVNLNTSSTANISICSGANYILPDGASQNATGTFVSHIPNAAGCDSSITTNLTVIPNTSSTANISICQGANYILPDGASQNTTGTFVSHIPNAAGCDSTITTNLTVIPNSSSTANISICQGSNYILPDGASQNATGTYVSHIPNTAGCDSAITTNLTVIPNTSSTANISICQGANYILPDGASQNATGTYVSHIPNAAGCDSTITTNLTVIPNSSSTANISICQGSNYILPDGVSQNTSGTYTSHIPNAAGCDSTITTNLTVIPNTSSTENISICQGANYILPDGTSQNTTGTFVSHIPNAAGCDSTITTNLTVIPNTSSTTNISICQGSNYILPDGASQNATGTYVSHIPNTAGCDSTITTNLTVIPNTSSTANIFICQGSNYILPDGSSQNTSGTYVSHIPNAAGCDSTVTTNLTVIPNSSSTANISICSGANYILPDGVSQNTSGTYTSHIPNTAGCDSTITINLTVIPNSSSTANISICQGSNYILPDGVSQNSAGTYISHIANATGCDSTITTNLTVNLNTSSTANILICSGANYILPDGASQNSTGTFVSHIPNAAGCDSSITTNLTVIPNTSSTANVSICQGANYILPDGALQNTTGTFVSHIQNAAGCDSTITTNLTVIPNSSSTANISICSGANYILPDGVSQNSTGTYVSHIPNAAGCDSTITTNLSVITNSSSTANISICQGSSYLLPDGVSQNTTGSYFSHIPNAAGCDSTITTNLTVIPNTSSTANVSICQGSNYILPDGSSQNTSGTYVSHIPNTAGCDSTITTNLTVIPNSSSTANISICSGANYILPDGVSQNTSGTYTSHIPNTAGCDSTITINLTVIPNSSSTANISICQGANYILPDGVSQNTSGTYTSHIPNAAGCDSTITTNLSVITNSSSTANISICSGANYILPDGVSQNSTGTYVSHIPNAAGCDSSITTNLTVIPNTSSTANVSICQGANYILPDGALQNTTGTFVSHIQNAAGCDSTITTNLTVIPNTSSTTNISICQGSNYILPGGASQNATGTYVTHIPNAAGCDSTITTNLTVIPNSSSTANISICSGANYILPDGVSQNSTGTYVSHIPNAAGCDSTITTNLSVITNSSSTANISICQGSSYLLPDGVSQNTTGSYFSHIPNAAGCDSSITTNLTVIPNTSSTANISICQGSNYILPDGTLQNTTGAYLSHIPNTAGCDSAITTNLTVIPNTSSTANISICQGANYILPDGASQNTTGTFISHIPNAAGCDSAITTNLTVIPNSSSTANISICQGSNYILPDGVSQNSTGTYVSHIPNAAGCDSAITTNLTVINNSSSTANISICQGANYTLPDGASQNTTGIYVSHIPNTAGCDSAITTNLTVIPNSSSTANIFICQGSNYILPDGASQNTTGTYVSHIPNAAGCDSTITTNLSVITNSSSTANISICSGANYILPDGVSQNSTGTYVSHIPNAAGCDSTITTNLSVITNSSSTANISICQGSSYLLPDGVSQNTTGSYFSHIPNAAGCDSSITTNLTVIPNSSSTANISICQGANYILPDGVSQNTSGTYISHIPNAAGCDSAITTNLTVNNIISTTANISICQGSNYILSDGISQNTSGTYISHIPNAAGCDSTITTNLTVINNASSTVNVSICLGSNYVLPDGVSHNTSGTYISHIPNTAGCDSAITTNLTVIPNTSSTANISICQGSNYILPDGASQNTTGTYVSHIPNAAGCDSSITTNLAVIPNTSSTTNISICQGSNYILPGGASQNATGTYVTHIPNAAGCDSTIITNLTVNPNTSSTANISICNGSNYILPDGVLKNTTGTYESHIPNAAGCDSSIITHLTVIPNTSSTANISICQGSNYILPDGVSQNTNGTYVSHIPNAAGCDSTITTNLTLIPNSSSTANISICQGSNFILPDGVSQNSTGTYVSHIPNAAGCDSSITTNLTVIPNSSSTANISICQGSNFILPDGVSQNSTGSYISHIPNAAGCDSSITTNLTVIPNSSSTANISICQGANYILPDGASQNTSGTYVSHIPNAAGCDSSITTNLTVIPNSSSTANISICQGSNYILPDGVSQNSAGTYISHIANATGCDSTITTNLTVNLNTSSTANISICSGANYILPDGASQNSTGTYISHIPNSAGCDSAITTNLTVISNSSSSVNISICQGSSYMLPDGVSQNSTGTYISHIPNAAGCDSAITTNLTVSNYTSSTSNVSVCQGSSYILPDGVSQNTSGTYISHIPNAGGCDSVITTNLAVNLNTSSIANILICSGMNYILPDGVSQNSNGTYISHIQNSAGCDSTITTNLTVSNYTSSISTVSICQGSSYFLPDGVSQNSSGTYISHIPNAGGCDSVITTNLTVISNSSSSVNISICQGSSYMLPDGITHNTSGTYISHLVNAAGCDSAITTNLTVKLNTSSTANIAICQGTSYILPGGISQNTSGSYISHIPNAAGCDSTITTNLTIISPPVLTATAHQISCFGGLGSVTLSTTGGQPPYVYGPGATTSLPQGTYFFSVTDNIGCTGNASATINAQPSPLLLSATPSQIHCYGEKGSVALNASGGIAPYTYGGSATSNLPAGTYNYNVTDNNGCQVNASSVINASPPQIFVTTSGNTIPCGSSIGYAAAVCSGGIGPYTYSWNTTPVKTTSTATGLPAGIYTVTITDNNGCTATKSAQVKNPTPPTCIITGITALCPGGGTTTLCAPTGMTSYLWNTGDTTRCITVNAVGTYTVTIRNAAGCTNANSVTTTISSLPVCTITGNGLLCPGSWLTLHAPTGYPVYTWSNGSHASSISIRNGGLYTVTVRNSAGCSSTCSTMVNEPLKVTLTPANGTCANAFMGGASVNATFGVPPYTYLWSNGTTSSTVSGLNNGAYSVRVTDATGCMTTSTFTIVVTKTAGDYSPSGANFNSTVIPANNYIWFSCVAKVNYTGTYPVTINFINQNVSSSRFNINPGNGKLILTNSVTQATTVLNGTEWVTTAPPNPTGEYFISGISFKTTTQILGNLNPVKWKGIWTSSSSCVSSVDWRWGAAVYSSFPLLLNQLQIKPVNGSTDSQYNNNNQPGTPENYTPFCIAGARGLGGNDYTGTFSVTVPRIPCSIPDVCPFRLSNDHPVEENTVDEIGRPADTHQSDFNFNAYPNPFSSKAIIEFERKDKSCHIRIDIFTILGQKVKTVFDNEVEQNTKQFVEFEAGNLENGIYIYVINSIDRVDQGTLLLHR